jgi:hypothetical protein
MFKRIIIHDMMNSIGAIKMYKCDFHIHTISTSRDSEFEFDEDRFRQYLLNFIFRLYIDNES